MKSVFEGIYWTCSSGTTVASANGASVRGRYCDSSTILPKKERRKASRVASDKDSVQPTPEPPVANGKATLSVSTSTLSDVSIFVLWLELSFWDWDLRKTEEVAVSGGSASQKFGGKAESGGKAASRKNHKEKFLLP